LIIELTPSASSSPSPFWMIVIDTAMSNVCEIAWTASGSSAIATKLSSPMNARSGDRPSQSVKA